VASAAQRASWSTPSLRGRPCPAPPCRGGQGRGGRAGLPEAAPGVGAPAPAGGQGRQPDLPQDMPSAFERVIRSVLRELDGSGELVPVDSLGRSAGFQPYCLLLRRRCRSAFWRPRFECVDMSIRDILEPDAPEPDTEQAGPFHFHDAVDGQLRGSVELAALGQGRLAGEATVSGSSSASMHVSLLSVHPNTWMTLRQERRLRQPEPQVLQQLRGCGGDLYVVTKALQTQREVEVTRTQRQEGSGQFALPAAVCLEGKGQGHLSRKRTVTIPAGSVLAFRPALLTIGSDWDVLLFPDKRQKTFGLQPPASPHLTWLRAGAAQTSGAACTPHAHGDTAYAREHTQQHAHVGAHMGARAHKSTHESAHRGTLMGACTQEHNPHSREHTWARTRERTWQRARPSRAGWAGRRHRGLVRAAPQPGPPPAACPHYGHQIQSGQSFRPASAAPGAHRLALWWARPTLPLPSDEAAGSPAPSEAWSGLRAEVAEQARGLSVLAGELRGQLLGSLVHVLPEAEALRGLEESLEQGLRRGHVESQAGPVGAILECLTLSCRRLEEGLTEVVLYLLGALAALTETQHGLLARGLDAGALLAPLGLVGSVLEQSAPWRLRQPVSLPAQLLGSGWGPEAPAWALLQECGLELRSDAPHVSWEPEARGQLCALYACLVLLSGLSQAQ
ncbi:LOW QUALITY PROTEIN: Gasdermin-D, partial [Galemys pyrenaicus]